jgi:hypothetical protein
VIAAAGDDLGPPLRNALEAVHERWTVLKASFPERFEVPLDGDWDGVYT